MGLQDVWTIHSMTGQWSSWTLPRPKSSSSALCPQETLHEGWLWHSTLQAGFVGKFWNWSSKNPLLFYTILVIPNPQQSRKFLPIPISPRIFFGLPRYIWTNPTFVLPLLPWQIRHYIAMCIARKQWPWRTPLGCPRLHLSKGWTQTLVAFQHNTGWFLGDPYTPPASLT